MITRSASKILILKNNYLENKLKCVENIDFEITKGKNEEKENKNGIGREKVKNKTNKKNKKDKKTKGKNEFDTPFSSETLLDIPFSLIASKYKAEQLKSWDVTAKGKFVIVLSVRNYVNLKAGMPPPFITFVPNDSNKLIEEFALQKELGHGNFGRIFPYRSADGKEFLIKVLTEFAINSGMEDDDIKTFRYIQKIQQNKQDNNVPCLQMNATDDVYIQSNNGLEKIDLLIMKRYIGNLSELLKSSIGDTQMSVLIQKQWKTIMLSIGQQLKCFYENYGLFYTDLKADNILFNILFDPNRTNNVKIQLVLGDIASLCNGQQEDCSFTNYPAQYDSKKSPEPTVLIAVWLLGFLILKIILKNDNINMNILEDLGKGQKYDYNDFLYRKIMPLLLKKIGINEIELLLQLLAFDPKDRLYTVRLSKNLFGEGYDVKKKDLVKENQLFRYIVDTLR